MKMRKLPLGDMNIVGANITAIRLEKNMKQKELLAKVQQNQMEIDASGLSKLEGQNRLVSDKDLIILSKALCVDVNRLLGISQPNTRLCRHERYGIIEKSE